jgi:hypothetical protein
MSKKHYQKMGDSDMSLSDVNNTVETNVKGGFWRKLLAFLSIVGLVPRPPSQESYCEMTALGGQ